MNILICKLAATACRHQPHASDQNAQKSAKKITKEKPRKGIHAGLLGG